MRRTVTLGTAGHIDHGKTALVRALTGVDTDRLPEEKRRGITIDLGFAHLDLTADLRIAIIDVPGHENFIRNMTAGATGIDLGLLVIAADEGIMPQTREHVAILELLGVRPAAIALTKCDLVEPDWRELVAEEITAELQHTRFAGVPTIAVSATSGEGLDQLRAVLLDAAVAASPRASEDLFRLPIDRVFTVRGTGTVVTGTVWTGQARVDQTARLLPSGHSVRIRTLQRHGEVVESIRAGERAAVALSGVAHTGIARGETLITSDAWERAHSFTAYIRVLDDVAWTAGLRRRVHVHLGTAAVIARLRPIGNDIGPGEEGWVLARLEMPLVVRAGDRFIMRSFSPVTTVAGGTVFEWAREPYRRKAAQIESLELLRSQQPEEQLRGLTLLAGWSGVPTDQIELLLNQPPDLRDFIVAGGRLFHPRLLEMTATTMLEGLSSLHEATPLRSAIDLQAFRRTAPPGASAALRDAATRQLVAVNRVELRGAGIALTAWRPQLTQQVQTQVLRLLASVDAAGMGAVGLDDLPGVTDVGEMLLLLKEQGQIVELAPGCYIGRTALIGAASIVAAGLEQGPRSASQLKDLLGVSRKHLIPLLEYLDRLGLTGREGAQRTLARVEVVSDLQGATR